MATLKEIHPWIVDVDNLNERYAREIDSSVNTIIDKWKGPDGTALHVHHLAQRAIPCLSGNVKRCRYGSKMGMNEGKANRALVMKSFAAEQQALYRILNNDVHAKAYIPRFLSPKTSFV